METKKEINETEKKDKAKAAANSDGLTKDLKQKGAEIKKNIKTAAVDIKKKVN